MAHISELARRTIEKLASDGIVPTFDELIWLNECGLAVEQPEYEVAPSLRGSPITCGNVVLWPMTVAAFEWYERAQQVIFGDRGRLLCMAYASCFGRNPSVLSAALTRYDIIAAINRWKLSCGATFDELNDALLRVHHELSDPHRVPSDPSEDIRTILAELVVGSGLDEDYWMARTPGEWCRHYVAIYRQNAAGVAAIDDKDEYRRRNLEFLKAVDAVRTAHTGKG